MFRIKICGITTIDDALTAAAAGADAIGLNFYPSSQRYVSVDRARAIAAALPDGVVKVGLFVNVEPAAICRVFDDLSLDLIQLHGDEPPEMLTQFGPRRTMKAFRVGEAGLAPVLEYLECCRALGCLPALVLLDSHVPGLYGGSGQAGDWTRLASYPRAQGFPPLILAGGLNRDNLADAIVAARPDGVDTASGVESQPGCKSPELVQAFVAAARRALAGG